MRRMAICLLAILFLAGCAGNSEPEETTQSMQLANPWTEYETLEKAEEAVGFSLGLPQTVAQTYQAEAFRVMGGQLLEVCYRGGSHTVTIRKMAGEGQDLSGDYTDYDTVKTMEYDGATVTTKYSEGKEGTAWLHLISCDGYSWSLRAPNGYEGDSQDEFLKYIGIQ